MAVNLNGEVRCAQAFGKAIVARGKGSIVIADGGYTVW